MFSMFVFVQCIRLVQCTADSLISSLARKEPRDLKLKAEVLSRKIALRSDFIKINENE